VIGPGWLDALDKHGKRRLDDPADTLREEIAIALKDRNIRVFPVLVGGAKMPEKDQLPNDIRDLAAIQTAELTVSHWNQDMSSLVGLLKAGALEGAEQTRSLGLVPLIVPALWFVGLNWAPFSTEYDGHKYLFLPIAAWLGHRYGRPSFPFLAIGLLPLLVVRMQLGGIGISGDVGVMARCDNLSSPILR